MDSYLADQSNWQALEQLASDGIVGVRIGVARLAGCLFGSYKARKRLNRTNLSDSDKVSRCSAHVPQPVVALVDRLRMDCSAEVRSYVPSPVDQPAYSDRSGPFETFSRPPPMTHRALAASAGRDPP